MKSGIQKRKIGANFIAFLSRAAFPFAILSAAISVSLFLAVASDNLSFLRHEQVDTTSMRESGEDKPLPFPVSVNPQTKTISEDPNAESYFKENLASASWSNKTHSGWLGKVLGTLARSSILQNLASPTSRLLVIQSGERKEEVAKNFSDILKWSKEQRALFMAAISSSSPELLEGKFYPGNYTVAKGALPEDVFPLVIEKFEEEILARYDESVEAMVPLKDALTIASLLEREAYDFEDMRQISGVIWNRLFIAMPLQIDATLQYTKGSRPSEPWWPKVLPSDKYIKSPYNTYQNEGLPPAPIANPSLDAIVAALNPKKTECYYYFHDSKGGFHCSATYEEHVKLLKQYFGRGK